MGMSPDVMKGLALGLTIVVAVIGVIAIPIILKKRQSEFPFGEAMAAAILLVAALLHLLPEAVELVPKPRQLMAGVICALTVVSLVLIEALATHIFSKPEEYSHAHDEGNNKNDSSMKSKDNDDKLKSTNNELGKMKHTSVISIGAFFLFVALSVHSFFDGLFLGARTSTDNVGATLIFVVAYKALTSFAFGQTLLKANYGLCTFLCMGIAFVLFAPISVAIGWGANWWTCHAFVGVVNAMVAGTLLFTGAYKMLPHVFETRGRIVHKSLGLIVGAGLLLLLLVLMDGGGHEHKCPTHNHDQGRGDSGSSIVDEGGDQASTKNTTTTNSTTVPPLPVGNTTLQAGNTTTAATETTTMTAPPPTTTATTTTTLFVPRPPPPKKTTTTTTTTTIAHCPTSGKSFHFLCKNGGICDYNKEGNNCCSHNERGGFMGCSIGLPYMCKGKRCSGNHCCKAAAASCDRSGGLLDKCPSTEPEETTTTTLPPTTTTTTTTTIIAHCPTSGKSYHFLCKDGSVCNYNKEGKKCCNENERGGFIGCSIGLPYMCKEKRCSGDHCCKRAAASCDRSGGLLDKCPASGAAPGKNETGTARSTARARSGTRFDHSESCHANSFSIVSAVIVTFVVTTTIMSCLFCCYIKKLHVASRDEEAAKRRSTLALSVKSSTASGWPKFKNRWNAAGTSQGVTLRKSRKYEENNGV